MDPEVLQRIAELQPLVGILPVIAAALIAGGSSIVGGLLSKSGQHGPQRIADPYKDPVAQGLGNYFNQRVGKKKPGYGGQLSAEYNPVLLAAIEQAMGQSQGFNNPINDLVTKFMSPAGSQGWNPVSAGWNRRPGDTTGSGSSAGLSPEVAAAIKSRMGTGG